MPRVRVAIVRAGFSGLDSAGPEILSYQKRIVEEHDLRDHLRLGADVLDAWWEDEARSWRVTTERDEWRADVLVDCAGPLTEPALPALPGLDRFAGTTFHSNRWRHDVDLRGRRVAVIGTGASAVQFIPASTGATA